MRGELLGRHRELAAIDSALDALDRGRSPGIFQIVGEPGIGKSRLLSELCARSEARGHVVVVGRAAEFERDLPFGVFLDALEAHLSSLEPREVGDLRPWLSELATIFPSLQPMIDGRPRVLQEERYRVYRAVRNALEQLARTKPLVVLLDDVHWADPASVELISHLLAHPPQGPAFVVLAFRPAQTPAPLDAALATAAREHPSGRLELPPLTRSEAESLLGTAADKAWREELFNESGGNPFYLEQLMRSARRRTVQTEAPLELTGSGVPSLVRAALAGELASLSAAARTLLQGAALAGDPFDDSFAAEAAGMKDQEALEVLDELLERDLVRSTSIPRRFRFRHPIVRRAVYESAGAAWRLRAHARLAEFLAARGASALARAHHVERSARRGDEGAIAVLVEAGHSAAPRAPATAAHWFGAALRFLAESPDREPQRLELLVARATALGAAGRLEESQAVLSQTLERLPAGTTERVKVATFCASVEHYLGHFETARARLRSALSELQDPRDPEVVKLKVELAVNATYANDFHEMLRWAEEAHSQAHILGDRLLEALGEALVAYAKYCLGRLGEASMHLDSARTVVDAADDAALAQRLDCGFWVGWTEAHMERLDDAIRHHERFIEISRSRGHGHFLVGLIAALAWALWLRGRLAEAMEAASEAAEASRLSAHALLSEAVGIHAVAALYAGDVASARQLAAESVALARSLDPGLVTAPSVILQAVVLLETGEAQRALEEVLAGIGGPDLPYIQVPAPRCLTYEILCRAEIALGRIDAAEEWTRRLESTIGVGKLPLHTAFAGRARASLLFASGNAAEAARLANEAAETMASLTPVEAARSRLLAARALAKVGNRSKAITQLERAEEELRACAAHFFVDHVSAELRRLGRRSRARTGRDAVGVDALSEREREIARLVCEGKTNRDIARHCYLSEKTVERHLSHIFTKLGVSSRAAVAGALARQSPLSQSTTAAPSSQ